MGRIKFRTGDLAAYNSLVAKDENTIYFITDTLQMYKGSELFGKSYQVVDSLPTTGKEGVLYIDRTNKVIKSYENGSWINALDVNFTVQSEVTVDGQDAVSGEAVAKYVQSAVDNVTGGATATIITGITKGDTFGTIKITQGITSNDVEVNLAGVVSNPSYNEDTRTIVLPRYGEDALVINLGKDLVVTKGEYKEDTQELVLTLTNDQVIRIPVASLVSAYTASTDISEAVKITIENNEIKGAVLVDDTTIKIVNGKLTANLSAIDSETIDELTGRIETAERDIVNLKSSISTLSSEIPSKYLSIADASNTYAEISGLNNLRSELTQTISTLEDNVTWQSIE